MENIDNDSEKQGGGIGAVVVFTIVIVALLIGAKFLMN